MTFFNCFRIRINVFLQHRIFTASVQLWMVQYKTPKLIISLMINMFMGVGHQRIHSVRDASAVVEWLTACAYLHILNFSMQLIFTHYIPLFSTTYKSQPRWENCIGANHYGNFVFIISAYHILVIKPYEWHITAHTLTVEVYISKFVSVKLYTMFCNHLTKNAMLKMPLSKFIILGVQKYPCS